MSLYIKEYFYESYIPEPIFSCKTSSTLINSTAYTNGRLYSNKDELYSSHIRGKNAVHLLAEVSANRDAASREYQPTDTKIADNDNVHDSDSLLFESFYKEFVSAAILNM